MKKKASFFLAFFLSFIFIFYSNINNFVSPVSADVVPVVTAVTSSVSNQTFTRDDVASLDNTIEIDVQFDLGIIVSDPTLLTLDLQTGPNLSDITTAQGVSLSADNKIVTFEYTVQNNQYTTNLDYVATDSLKLNGAIVTDIFTTAPDNADLTLPTPGTASSLSANNIVIDTTAPSVQFSTGSPYKTNVNPVSLSLWISKAGTDFDYQTDLTLTGATYGNAPTSSDGKNYSFTLIPNGEGTISLAVADGVFSDASGNDNTGATLDVIYDVTTPTITAVTDYYFPTNTRTTTPAYQFMISEPGMATLGGSCGTKTQHDSSTATPATVTFDTLAEGTYADCTLSFIDDAGNTAAATLAIPSFTVDTTRPEIISITLDSTDVSTVDSKFFTNKNNIDVTIELSETPTVFGVGSIVVNEIAWMGSDNGGSASQDADDEWIELYNTSGVAVDITGWTLRAADGVPDITLSGTIPAYGYFLLERTDDNSATGVTADQIYVNSLGNSGEDLVLRDNAGKIIHEVDADSGWPAGNNTSKETMGWNGLAWITGTSTPRALNTGATAYATSLDGLWNSLDIVLVNATLVSGSFVQSDTNPLLFTFSVQPTIEGQVDVSVAASTFMDLAGNTNTVSDITTFVYDTTVPVLSSIVLTTIQSISNDPEPEFTISSNEKGTIAVSGACSISNSEEDISIGSNTIELEALSEGSYSDCGFTVSDYSGNITAVTTLPTFTIDITKPVITISINGNTTGYTNQQTVTLSVKMSEATDVLLESDISDNLTNATIVSGTFTQSTVDSTLYTVDILLTTDGSVTLAIPAYTVVDTAGNQNIATSFTVIYDTVKPIISLATPVSDIINSINPSAGFYSNEVGTVSFTSGSACAISAGVNAQIRDNTVAPNSLVLDLPNVNATYNCSFFVTDAAGNQSNDIVLPTFVVDIDAPTAVLSTPSLTVNGSFVVTITFSSDVDLSTFTVLGNISISSDGYFTGSEVYDMVNKTVTMTVYPHSDINPVGDITIYSKGNSYQDLARNYNTVSNSLVVHYDINGPTISVDTTPLSYPPNATPSVTLTANHDGTVVFGAGCSSLTSNITAATSTTFQFNTLSEGVYNCTATFTDTFGNTPVVLTLSQFTIDTIAPQITLSVSNTNTNGSFTVQADFDTDVDLSTFSLSDVSLSASVTTSNYVQIDSNTISFDVTFVDTSVDPTAVLTVAIGTFSDLAGNTNNTSATTSVTYDTTAPVASTGSVNSATTNTPSISITVDEPSTLVFSGSCSGTVSLTAGANVVPLGTLSDGTYSSCTYVVTNSWGVASSPVTIPSFTVDTVAPTVISVSATGTTSSYEYVGDVIYLSVLFSEPVSVTGTPTLTLSSGGTAVYGSGLGTNTLVFAYTTVLGESSSALDYVDINSLVLSGATISDASSNNASVTLPVPGSANSLSGTSTIAIAITKEHKQNSSGSVATGGSSNAVITTTTTTTISTIADKIKDIFNLTNNQDTPAVKAPVTIPVTETNDIPDVVVTPISNVDATIPLVSKPSIRDTVATILDKAFPTTIRTKDGSTQTATAGDALSSNSGELFKDTARSLFSRIGAFMSRVVHAVATFVSDTIESVR